MHAHDLTPWRHAHQFRSDNEAAAERRTKIVLILTLIMMVAEIVAGSMFNSMALLADGWHMSTHAGAMAIAAFAYAFTRRHAEDGRFTFGTGKVGVLGGFSSAMILAFVALMMTWESLVRLTEMQTIGFDEALVVAIIGLVVNLICAFILGDHGHSHDHDHGHGHQDHNLRAAYVHVVADALTSVLAIGALLLGKYLGWWWMDPVMGLVGAAIIAKWAWGLMQETGAVLLDHSDDSHLEAEVRTAIESDADNRLTDLHLWRIGSGHWAAIVSVVTHTPRPPSHYKVLLSDVHELSHVTVEVLPCLGEASPPGSTAIT